MVKIRKITNCKLLRIWKKPDPSHCCLQECESSGAVLEVSQVFKRFNHKVAIGRRKSTPRYISKRNIPKYLYMNIHSSIIHTKKQKHPKSTDELVSKM